MAKQTNKKLSKTLQNSGNITWQNNQTLIRGAFLKVLNKEKRAPQLNEISDATGLSLTTLNKHMKSLNLNVITNKAKILSEDVVMAIYNSAIKGSAASQKLWAQLVEGWKETSDLNVNAGLTIIRDTIKAPKDRKKNRN